MKLLHTSDWHLGHSLYGKKRYGEFEAFLDWLIGLIEAEKIDGLLIAGDVFDTVSPTNRAQQLYYDFLGRLRRSSCRHIVITGGNHDSPTFLEASKSLLESFRIHVCGASPKLPEDEILVLENANGVAEAIVLAVPYLRERDVTNIGFGVTFEERDRKISQGIADHYRTALEKALGILEERKITVPIIAMGHLFAAGTSTGIVEDGVRPLYVGSLGNVSPDVFSERLDYVALGHLHSPQTVGKRNNVRYCGSPIPMSFEEAASPKQILLLDFKDAALDTITPIIVPAFQELRRLSGGMNEIAAGIQSLKEAKSNAWIEIVHTGPELLANLPEQIETLVSGSMLEPLRIIDRRTLACDAGGAPEMPVSLESMTPRDVFQLCLDTNGVPPGQRPQLMQAYEEIIAGILQSDTNDA